MSSSNNIIGSLDSSEWHISRTYVLRDIPSGIGGCMEELASRSVLSACGSVPILKIFLTAKTSFKVFIHRMGCGF